MYLSEKFSQFILIKAHASPNIVSANAFTISVFPTQVGP